MKEEESWSELEKRSQGGSEWMNDRRTDGWGIAYRMEIVGLKRVEKLMVTYRNNRSSTLVNYSQCRKCHLRQTGDSKVVPGESAVKQHRIVGSV